MISKFLLCADLVGFWGDVDGLFPWARLLSLFLLPAIAIYSIFQVKRNWKEKHVTEEWSRRVEFMLKNCHMMDPSQNDVYTSNYQGKELVEYNLFARLCVAYVDDLFHMELGVQMKGWIKGAVPLFVSPHYRWYLDNRHYYTDEFNRFVEQEIKVIEARNSVSDSN